MSAVAGAEARTSAVAAQVEEAVSAAAAAVEEGEAAARRSAAAEARPEVRQREPL